MPSSICVFAPNKISTAELDGGAVHWGGKGFGLMQACADGLPVPPGFTLSTALCRAYMKNPTALMAAVEKDLPNWLNFLQEQFDYMPLVSVRSGARVSMPGMMDTVLNVGLTDENRKGEWEARIGAACALDSQKRLEQMFNTVIGAYAPPDPTKQILACIEAVFKSWNSPRAIEYRKIHNIPNDWGTAVTVQAMVFGNMGDASGTGVAFTRDPSTGEAKIVGEFLPNAQGEDVVAGLKQGFPLTAIRKAIGVKPYNDLMKLLAKLETTHRDMQDVEFTFQQGKLYLLQTRSGKRSAAAAFKIADDMVEAGTITLAEARKRVSFAQFVTAQRPALDFKATMTALGKAASQGLAGSIGVAVGRVAFNEADVLKLMTAKDPIILVRHETTPDDIAMMAKSVGILTATGGFTSHAAVVARGMDIPCVTGCADLDTQGTSPALGGLALKAGDWLTLDGSTGAVWRGKGVTAADTDGASIRLLSRVAADEGVRLLTPTPASRAYCTAAEADDLVAWATVAREIEEAVIDLRGLTAWVSGEDAAFIGLIGQVNHNLAAAIDALCEVTAKQGVRVIMDDHAPAEFYAKLDAAGYIPVRAVNSLEDAMTTKGELRFGLGFKALAGGAKGEAFLREVLEEKGATFADTDTGLSTVDAARKLLDQGE